MCEYEWQCKASDDNKGGDEAAKVNGSRDLAISGGEVLGTAMRKERIGKRSDYEGQCCSRTAPYQRQGERRGSRMGEWREITNRRGGATSLTRERRIGLSSRNLLRERRKAGSQLGSKRVKFEKGHIGRARGAGDVLLRPAAISLYLDKGDQLICIAQVAHCERRIRSPNRTRVATGIFRDDNLFLPRLDIRKHHSTQ
jgi:hypothetical protein